MELATRVRCASLGIENIESEVIVVDSKCSLESSGNEYVVSCRCGTETSIRSCTDGMFWKDTMLSFGKVSRYSVDR